LDSLVDIAQAAVQAATAAGADWADAICASGRSVEVEVGKSSIKQCEAERNSGIGVRAYVNGAVGLARSQSLESDQVAACARQAVTLARAAHRDPDFVALPQPSAVQRVPELFDEDVAGLDSARVVRWCQEGIDEAHGVNSNVALSGGASLAEGEYGLASSTGAALSNRGTSIQIFFMAVVRDGDDVGSYFEYDIARRLEDFEPVGVAGQATEQAGNFLGARHIKTARLPVVMGPLSADGFLTAPIEAADAESIQRERSYMVGKAGSQIGSKAITIIEDPFVPAGVSSQGWDAEGVPKQRRALIDAGVLTTYLHNSYTANKAGVDNTAHAARSGYSPGVGISASNLLIEPGQLTEAELIAEIDEGLYINAAQVQPDSASGDLSVTVDFGFKIEDGQLAYPVKNTMIGGHILELLQQVDAVSSDYREEPGSIIPSVRLSAVQIIGAE